MSGAACLGLGVDGVRLTDLFILVDTTYPTSLPSWYLMASAALGMPRRSSRLSRTKFERGRNSYTPIT